MEVPKTESTVKVAKIPKPRKVKREPNSFVKALKETGYWTGGSLKPFPKKGTKEHQDVLDYIARKKPAK